MALFLVPLFDTNVDNNLQKNSIKIFFLTSQKNGKFVAVFLVPSFDTNVDIDSMLTNSIRFI